MQEKTKKNREEKENPPLLFSVLDLSPRRTPPPIHTAGGETLQHLTSSIPKEN